MRFEESEGRRGKVDSGVAWNWAVQNVARDANGPDQQYIVPTSQGLMGNGVGYMVEACWCGAQGSVIQNNQSMLQN